MQTENLSNNGHKQFYVILNTNQIKFYTCILICWTKKFDIFQFLTPAYKIV